jgi:uncharacterized integral membrane protein
MARRRRGARSDWQLRLYLRLAVLMLAVAYLIAFVIKNKKDTSVDFVFASTKVSLIWMILLTLAFGLVGGVLLSQLHRHRHQRREARDALPDLGDGDEAEGEAGRTVTAGSVDEEV